MNPAPAAAGPGNTWLIFALLTVLSWGVYGVILHKGRGYMPMGSETPHAGLKAFLFVCIAYAIIGVASAVLLKVRGSDWSLTPMGIQWSLIAGVTGALGAVTLVLALGAAAPIYKGAAAAAVMPIVFGGAPVINTLVAMLLNRFGHLLAGKRYLAMLGGERAPLLGQAWQLVTLGLLLGVRSGYFGMEMLSRVLIATVCAFGAWVF